MTSTWRELVPGNIYDKRGTKNPIARVLYRSYLRALDELLPRETPNEILEVGSGEGLIVEHVRRAFPESKVAAIDLSIEMARMTRDRIAGTRCVCASAHEIPFPAKRFDLILCVEVLEHLLFPEQAMHEIVRVARGHVILSVPREPLWRVLNVLRGAYCRDLGNTPGHIQHWTARDFVQFVGGFIEIQEIRIPLPWVMIAGRLKGI